jgi:hypothetical protein
MTRPTTLIPDGKEHWTTGPSVTTCQKIVPADHLGRSRIQWNGTYIIPAGGFRLPPDRTFFGSRMPRTYCSSSISQPEQAVVPRLNQ